VRQGRERLISRVTTLFDPKRQAFCVHLHSSRLSCGKTGKLHGAQWMLNTFTCQRERLASLGRREFRWLRPRSSSQSAARTPCWMQSSHVLIFVIALLVVIITAFCERCQDQPSTTFLGVFQITRYCVSYKYLVDATWCCCAIMCQAWNGM